MAERTLQIRWYTQIQKVSKDDYHTIPINSIEEGVKILEDLEKANNNGIGVIYQLKDNQWKEWYDSKTGEDNPKIWVNTRKIIKENNEKTFNKV